MYIQHTHYACVRLPDAVQYVGRSMRDLVCRAVVRTQARSADTSHTTLIYPCCAKDIDLEHLCEGSLQTSDQTAVSTYQSLLALLASPLHRYARTHGVIFNFSRPHDRADGPRPAPWVATIFYRSDRLSGMTAMNCASMAHLLASA
jgi:hypothetical protein